MTQVVDLSALELSVAIERRELTCREVATAFLERIDRIDPVFCAFSSRRPASDVLEEAIARDEEIDGGLRRGWMHGVPHAVKDLSDVMGLPTTLGFRRADSTPDAVRDDPFVSRIRSAGAVFIGKTNTPEFGLGSHTYNAIGPTTGNVTDAALSAGGSSGGAAVAVATGMVSVADGSDFMGSLRNPPGWNGVLGLRPTTGLVPSATDDPTAAGSGVEGPIARTVADLHALLQTMAGPGRLGPLVLPPASSGARVAWLGDLGGYLPFESGVLEVCLEAVSSWGDHVVTVSLPSVGAFTGLDQLWPAWQSLRHHEVGGWLAAEFGEAEILTMKPEAQWELAGFRALSARQLDHARRVRDGVRRSLLSALEHFDLLALPTAQCWPFPAALHWPTAIDGAPMDTYHRWMEVTTLATLAGLPAMSVPAGKNASGLHMGLQLIGRPGGDAELLGWAAHAERAGVFQVATPTRAVGA